jgi:hypothetical protein
MKDLNKLKKHELIELGKIAQYFFWDFEVLFDGEWVITKGNIECDPEGFLIKNNGGTFINPLVKDESNNWANRGSLLHNYRELKKILSEKLETEEEILF